LQQLVAARLEAAAFAHVGNDAERKRIVPLKTFVKVRGCRCALVPGAHNACLWTLWTAALTYHTTGHTCGTCLCCVWGQDDDRGFIMMRAVQGAGGARVAAAAPVEEAEGAAGGEDAAASASGTVAVVGVVWANVKRC
jgi:hypothetical protein